MDGNIITDPEVNELINEAQLCRIFHCLPSDLEKEDPAKIQACKIVYEKMLQKNPLMGLLM